jgi:hypothetical protein
VEIINDPAGEMRLPPRTVSTSFTKSQTKEEERPMTKIKTPRDTNRIARSYEQIGREETDNQVLRTIYEELYLPEQLEEIAGRTRQEFLLMARERGCDEEKCQALLDDFEVSDGFAEILNHHKRKALADFETRLPEMRARL